LTTLTAPFGGVSYLDSLPGADTSSL